jgi:threonine/homoserine/homoserine lactone efflux protein
MRHYLNIHIFALLLGFAVLSVLAVLGLLLGISPIPQLLLGLSILAAAYNLGHSLLNLWSAEETRHKSDLGPTADSREG